MPARRTDFPQRPSQTRGGRWRYIVATCLLADVSVCLAQFPAAAVIPPSSAPTTRPVDAPHSQPPAGATQAADGLKRFAQGVAIDWHSPAVHVDGRIVLREGPLEFLACFAGKEHESIVRLNASAAHIYQALGLIGVAPGAPPRWDDAAQRYEPASGDLLELSFAWRDGAELRRAPAASWLLESEYEQVAPQRFWHFAGSRLLDDGTLACERSGSGVALVDFSDSLLALPRGFANRDAELWSRANTAAIPAIETPVTLILQPARWQPRSVQIDAHGRISIDGRRAQPEDLLESLRLMRQLEPAAAQPILDAALLRADIVALRRKIERAGIAADAIRFERIPPRR